MLERLDMAYVRPATHQADKRKQPKARFSCAVFSDWMNCAFLEKVQVCWCELQKLSCLQAGMDLKGIKLKDELYVSFLPLNHFVQVFWSLKKTFPCSSASLQYVLALSPQCALPGPGTEPEAPKGLYLHPRIYKSVGDWHCSFTQGRKTAGSCFQ